MVLLKKLHGRATEARKMSLRRWNKKKEENKQQIATMERTKNDILAKVKKFLIFLINIFFFFVKS